LSRERVGFVELLLRPLDELLGAFGAVDEPMGLVQIQTAGLERSIAQQLDVVVDRLEQPRLRFLYVEKSADECARWLRVVYRVGASSEVRLGWTPATQVVALVDPVQTKRGQLRVYLSLKGGGPGIKPGATNDRDLIWNRVLLVPR
jgi:hypothetical protein